LPVIGVPGEMKSLKSLDSLLSVAQMPKGIAVGCMAIGKSRARNAAIFALEILGLSNKRIQKKLVSFKKSLAKEIKLSNINLIF